MIDTPDLAAILADPTRCYVSGCERENQILVHLRSEPWAGADLCATHAAQAVRASETVLTCDCVFCARARNLILGVGSKHVLALVDASDGLWLVLTLTGSTYFLDLDGRSMARAPAAAGVALRHDGHEARVERVLDCAVGHPARFLLRGIAETGVATLRTTSNVIAIVRHDP